jgi:hypothetical protein
MSSIDAIQPVATPDDVWPTLTIPPARPADSFVLHAPLELAARSKLLAMASDDARPAIVARIDSIAADWTAFSAPLDNPNELPPGADPEAHLRAAAAAGDIYAADAAFVALCRTAEPDQVLDTIARLTLDRLGGAAHAAIFVDQVGRSGDVTPLQLLSARALLIDIVREWEWRIRWIDDIDPHDDAHDDAPPATLFGQLVDVPSPGDPGGTFIYPTMSIVDRTGLARDLIAPTLARCTVADARMQLLRVAAHSMLQDDPEHAPYGWTHCLTMPQAVLNTAGRHPDATRSIAVAATYVCGFRATQSTNAIDPAWVPDRVDPALTLSDATPIEAAGLLWHATQSRSQLVQQLIDDAGTAEDAHLAKYTEACLTAARHDPAVAHLFHAAMAYLAAW